MRLTSLIPIAVFLKAHKIMTYCGRIITNEADAILKLEEFSRYKKWVLDLETTGLRPWVDSIIGVALNGYYFVILDSNLNPVLTQFIGELWDYLDQKDRVIIGHNIKFDFNFLRFYKKYLDRDPAEPIKCSIWDTMVGMHIINENLPTYALKPLSEELWKGSTQQSDELDNQLKLRGLKKNQMYALPLDLVGRYAIQDIELTKKLFWYEQKFYEDNHELLTVAIREMEIIKILSDMEVRGLKIDLNKLRELKQEAEKNVFNLQDTIKKMWNKPDLNLNSNVQVSAYLKMKSVSKAKLEECKNIPGVQELLEYRAWQKVLTSYYQVFEEIVDDNGCVHTNLIPMAATGRIRCSNPNLQALPRQDKIHKVKEVFIPHNPEYVYVFADYAQAEMRLATHYAKEATMAKIINSGKDIHAETAVELFDIPEGHEVSKDKRTIAKRINFGIIYGIGATALAENLGISIDEASAHLINYRGRFPGFAKLAMETEKIILSRGTIKYFTGRKRHLKACDSYKALNSLIQGGISEIVKIDMVRLYTAFLEKGYRAYQVMQIHDEIIVEAHKSDVNEVTKTMKDIMEDWNFMVPMKVEITIKENWGPVE